ncbi:MAG: ABC transporter permease [Propionibacteriaceae bacterium]|nr:ABC transporter permease [Propionibacteriaceae bacterium]
MKWLRNNWQEIPGLVADHVTLSIPAIVLSVIIAVPIGRLAHKRRLIGGPVLGIASMLYAIPSLPLIIAILVLTGLSARSMWTMTIALTVYGVALLVRTSADAFAAVDKNVHDAAVAMGHSGTSVFWRVDLPLAVPVLVSGIRVMTVSTVSLVTVGALVGQSGLGWLLTNGFQRGIAAEVATGVIATALLAVILDGLVMVAGRLLTPWAARRHRRTKSARVTARPRSALA